MEVDLLGYLRVLRKRKRWLVAALIVGLSGGLFITASATPQYQAKATLFVGERQFVVEALAAEAQVQELTISVLGSYSRILTSRTIAQRAVADAGLDLSPGAVQHGLSSQVLVGTQIIELTFTGADPVRAQRVVNAVADAFVEDIDRLDGRRMDGQPVVRVSIIDRALAPSAPVAPNSARNLVLATALGLAAGLGLVVLVEQLDVTVKHREELEHLGLPLLGSVPRMNTKGEEVHVESDQHGLGGESFRKLRTSIGFLNLEAPVRSFLVTSSVPQEGKTTVAVNLAVAYALGGLRTLLVEADLRRPSLHRRFGMSGTRGLTTAIVGEVPLSEAILPTETRNLSVMLAGAIPPNPVELLGSDQMAELMDRLERMFDMVVVDSPPTAPVADPAALAARCGGVIVVARTGKTDRRRLAETARVVERAGGRFLGVVLNFLKPSDAPYEYDYYYYGYGGKPESVDAGDRDREDLTMKERA